MVHVIIGVAAICWGMWKLSPDWMFVGQVLKILLFVALVGFGLLSILAGLRRLRANS